jgi:hypothetical protein
MQLLPHLIEIRVMVFCVEHTDREALPAGSASCAIDYLFYSSGFSGFGLLFAKKSNITQAGCRQKNVGACFIQNLTTGNLVILCSMFCALIIFLTFLKEPTNSLGFMNIILLHSNHRYVSTTHIAIFRLIRTKIQVQL